jgi:hypothetical protein
MPFYHQSWIPNGVVKDEVKRADVRYWPCASLSATQWFGRYRRKRTHFADTANRSQMAQIC